MLEASSLLVRRSGRLENRYYIDYRGLYSTADIALEAGMEEAKVVALYEKNHGALDAENGVYYFPTGSDADAAVAQVLKTLHLSGRGRPVLLTEQEISAIRRALIGDGASPFGISSRVKDSILKKLNG